jgi:hypothetical protein
MLNPDPSIEGAENISLSKIILTCKGGLVRIGVPKDGSCLFHSVIRAFSKDYVDSTKEQRYDMVKNIRNKLSVAVSERIINNEFYSYSPSKTYYDILSSGNLSEMGKTLYEYSIEGIKLKLLSMQSVGMEFIELLGMFLKLDIYIIDMEKRDLYCMGKDTSNYYKYRQSIVIAYIQNKDRTDGHYEVVGLNIKNIVYTIFEPDNFFIISLRKRQSDMVKKMTS